MNPIIRDIMERKIKKQNGEVLIFSNMEGNMVNIQSNIQSTFLRLQKQIGVDNIINLSCLRHTYIINYLLEGGSLIYGKKILGFSSFNSILQYAHAEKTFRERESKRVEF